MILLFVMVSFCIEMVAENKSFVVVIPSWNNQEWFIKNLESVFSQDYSHYRVIYIDDRSTDETYACVRKYLKEKKKLSKVTLIKNKKRQGALKNYYDAVHLCKNDEIIVCLDGDDWLAHNHVFSILNEVYANRSVWLTYGQMSCWPNSDYFACHEVPSNVVDSNGYRSYDWATSHLKTFYAWIFKQVDIEDLKYEGKFFEVCSDLAYMFPMLEMAGHHATFVNEILYVYNTANSVSDFKKKAAIQESIEDYIRSKKPYERLHSFVVVIPSYNNAKWSRYNLNSVFDQKYPCFRVIYIDDCSSDCTYTRVAKQVKKNEGRVHFDLLRNEVRSGALANHYKALYMCHDDEIIVSLDGDDWFAYDYVLTFLNHVYQDPNIWLTYGQFCNWPTGLMGWCEDYSQDSIEKNEFREFGFVAAQPRTYRVWLAKKINRQDLLDDEPPYKGQFYQVAGDAALMFPMLEMAGDRFKFIPDVLTQRNVATELNDYKVRPDFQMYTVDKICGKSKYKKLE